MLHILLTTSAFFASYKQADMFGKIIFLSLFFLSCISWVILVHKVFLTRKLRKLCENFEHQFQGKEDNLLQYKLEMKEAHPYGKIYEVIQQRTLEILNKNRYFIQGDTGVYLSNSDIGLVASHIEVEISKQNKWIEKNIFILPTVVTLSPFIGLLGTVWGILLTFSNLQVHSISAGNSAVLSGLSLALTTTVLGLVVAIPALIAYNYLRSSMREFSRDMENFSHRLLASIELQYRKVDRN
jgi:biopolymer transport protein TolQ